MESKIDPLDKEYFTIETAREMTQPTDKFICEPDDNTFGIKFIRFRIRDMDSGETIADIQHPQDDDFDENYLTEAERVIHYNFGPRFLELKTIGTLLDFKIGDKPVKNLVLIERHYFKDKLIEGYTSLKLLRFYEKISIRCFYKIFDIEREECNRLNSKSTFEFQVLKILGR